MGFKWPEEIAHNLPMKEIFSLKFDAFIREIGDATQGDHTLFLGTDGGQSIWSRCGGRLPAVYVLPGKTDKDFRIDFKEHTEKRLNDVWLGEIQLQNGIYMYLIKLKKIQNKTIDLNFVFLFIDYDWVYLLVMFQEIFVNFFGIFLPFKVH